MTGWIKLHRKLLISDMYQDLNAVQRDVLLQCLLAANHKPKKWEWQGKIFECVAGQFITSLDSLTKLCAKGTSIRNVRTALVKLEMWEFLTNESTKTGRLITVTNWGTYQDCDSDTDKAIDKAPTKLRQSTDKEPTTNKNDKEVKNEKKKDIHIDFPELNIEAWSKWLDYKKQIKSKYKTENGELNKIKELIKLSGGDKCLQNKIVQQSIDEEWKGLFALKADVKKSKPDSFTGLHDKDYGEAGADGRDF